MKHIILQILVLLSMVFFSQMVTQMYCKNDEHGALTTLCVQATPSYFKRTAHRFGMLDEIVRCVNCILTVIEANTFDLVDNQIKVLDLTDAQISVLKPKSFIGLVFLQKLLLAINRITTVPAMTFLGTNQIRYLDLQNNTIIELVVNGFKELSNLQTLLLQNNYIQVIGKGAFNGLTSLEILDLSNNRIEDIGGVFDDLGKLASLNLENNKIKEIRPMDINNVSNLVVLNLAGNRLKSIAVGTFISFPLLETLNLAFNPIGSIVEGSLRGLVALKDLYISNGEVPDIPKGVFSDQHYLRTIDLSSNKIVSFETGVYSGLPELQSLNVSHNKIASFTKSGIFPLQKLNTLDMSHNQLEDLDYKLLVDHMPALSYLELSHNPWHCYIAKEIDDEFKHDNLQFSLGVQFDDGNITCNDTGLRHNTKEMYDNSPETSPFVVKAKSYPYVLYSFICVLLGVLACLFYLQFKNQELIRSILAKTSAPKILRISSDMSCKDEFDNSVYE